MSSRSGAYIQSLTRNMQDNINTRTSQPLSKESLEEILSAEILLFVFVEFKENENEWQRSRTIRNLNG
jgi:hypothetical protein